MMATAPRIGIVAGGGALPLAIARSLTAQGWDVFVLALEGMAEPSALASFDHAFVSLGEIGKALETLKNAGVGRVTLAGGVARPKFGALKLDARGALLLPRIVSAAMKGDDALLRAIIMIFEQEGFSVLGSGEVAQDLLPPGGALGTCVPAAADKADIAVARKVVAALGALDVGQATVVCEGLVLAVEAAEGTDAMLERVRTLPEVLRGTPVRRRGVLVKAPKPGQERRVDLPVVGVDTLARASAAGLSGIAVEAGGALILDRMEVTAAADAASMFVYAFAPESAPE